MNTLNQSGLLQKTEDYSLFKYRDDNRDVCPNHVQKLVFSMKRNFDLHLHPIVVNQSYEIIDGQHRFEAAKELNMPIFYIMDLNFDPQKLVTFNTTQRRWLPPDYLKFWCSHGKEDYQKLNDFVRDIKLPLSLALVWLSHEGNSVSNTNFKNGAFKFELPQNVLDGIVCTNRLIEHMKDINFKPQSIFNQRDFHRGCKKFFLNPVVDTDLFFERLVSVPFKLRPSKRSDEYIEQFVEIYNYKARTSRISVVKNNNGSMLLQ